MGKCLNIGYNNDYNNKMHPAGWIEKALRKIDRRNAFVHFSPHCETRMATRNINIEKIVETARLGRVLKDKSRFPNTIAFKRFFKEGYTYVAITEVYPNSLQVKTVWRKRGKI